MNNTVWQMSPSDRLKEWRYFRKKIAEKELFDAMQDVIDWWKLAPLSSRVLDIYDNSTWPDPWELLHNGEYDENSIALGMAYTLSLNDIPCNILLVQSRKESYLGLIVFVDEKYILNYTYGEINDKSILDDSEVLQTYNVKELIS